MDVEVALRERLVDAGVELVLTEGTSSVGLREIARRAGVSHGAPRRYFPTHRALLSAIARRGFEELGARCNAAIVQTSDPRAQLRSLAGVYVAYALERRGMFELMFRHDVLDSAQQSVAAESPRLREVTLPMFDHFVELVARCRSEATEPAASVAAAALWANLHGIAQLWCWSSLQLVLASAAGGEAPASPGGLDPLIDAALVAHLGPASG